MKKIYYYFADKLLNYLEKKHTTLNVDHDFFEEIEFTLLDYEEEVNNV